MGICIWSLLIKEPCSTCSHSDWSVTAEPTNQILLIILTPLWKRERWVNFDDNDGDGGDDDDDHNDDDDDDDDDDENNLWRY